METLVGTLPNCQLRESLRQRTRKPKPEALNPRVCARPLQAPGGHSSTHGFGHPSFWPAGAHPHPPGHLGASAGTSGPLDGPCFVFENPAVSQQRNTVTVKDTETSSMSCFFFWVAVEELQSLV